MNADPVGTGTGRPMTGALQRALDNLTGAHRRAAVQVLQESTSPTLALIHHALAVELGISQLCEDMLLRDLKQDLVNGVPAGSPWS